MSGETYFVYIDDNPDPAIKAALGDTVSVFSYPDEIEEEYESLLDLMKECLVIIVDLKLFDDSEVEDKPANSDEVRLPPDGLALKELLSSWLSDRREQLQTEGNHSPLSLEPRSTAFVLYTGELDRLAAPYPAFGREHVIARRIHTEWVMQKRADLRPKSQKDLRILFELADAVQQAMNYDWANLEDREKTFDALRVLLDLDSTEWAEHAERTIFDTHPPMQSLAEGDALSVVRWLLHVVLPFPSFLIDAEEIGLALRVQPSWMAEQLAQQESLLSKELGQYQYSGILSDFLGRRWWRAGILRAVRRLSSERSFDSNSVIAGLSGLLQMDRSKIPILQARTPVRLIDEDFRLTSEVSDVDEAVRIDAEDWPPALTRPWIAISEVARSKRLQRYVVKQDIDRLRMKLDSAK